MSKKKIAILTGIMALIGTTITITALCFSCKKKKKVACQESDVDSEEKLEETPCDTTECNIEANTECNTKPNSECNTEPNSECNTECTTESNTESNTEISEEEHAILLDPSFTIKDTL